MTVTAFLDLIRPLRWSDFGYRGRIRVELPVEVSGTQSRLYCCPLTAAYLLQTGRILTLEYGADAGRALGFPSHVISAVIAIADNSSPSFEAFETRLRSDLKGLD